jgi:sugar phosphate isomerase/epimerase
MWQGAFSTLGCSGAPLEQVIDIAVRGPWRGVELRAAPDEPVHVGLTAAEREGSRRLLADAGIGVLAVASYVEVDAPDVSDEACIADLVAHVELASDLGAPFVRVFPGGPSGNGAAARRLIMVAPELERRPGVAVALETHDSCRRGADVAALLARVEHPQIRAIWDIQHPWLAGEAVADTCRALAPWLAYVQLSDVRALGDPTPCVPGTGSVPLGLVRHELQRAGYEGWVSLEWPSYWFPELPPLEEALAGAERWLDGSLPAASRPRARG